jgi:hypothetical protein
MNKDAVGFWAYRSCLDNDIYHLFLGDFDCKDMPLRKPREWALRSPNGWHIIRMDSLTIRELVQEQEDRGCCLGFITSTVTKGYAELRSYGPRLIAFKDYVRWVKTYEATQ